MPWTSLPSKGHRQIEVAIEGFTMDRVTQNLGFGPSVGIPAKAAYTCGSASKDPAGHTAAEPLSLRPFVVGCLSVPPSPPMSTQKHRENAERGHSLRGHGNVSGQPSCVLPDSFKGVTVTQEQRDRLSAYYAESRRLSGLADEAMGLCAYHPCPPPSADGFLVPRACTCYVKHPDYRAFMALRSPMCDLCGGWEKCKRGCEAFDAQF